LQCNVCGKSCASTSHHPENAHPHAVVITAANLDILLGFLAKHRPLREHNSGITIHWHAKPTTSF